MAAESEKKNKLVDSKKFDAYKLGALLIFAVATISIVLGWYFFVPIIASLIMSPYIVDVVFAVIYAQAILCFSTYLYYEVAKYCYGMTITNKELYLAVEKGNLDEVEKLLGEPCNVNVNADNKFYQKAIDVAAEKGHIEICKLLLLNGSVEPQYLTTIRDDGVEMFTNNYRPGVRSFFKSYREKMSLCRNAVGLENFSKMTLTERFEKGAEIQQEKEIQAQYDQHLKEQARKKYNEKFLEFKASRSEKQSSGEKEKTVPTTS